MAKLTAVKIRNFKGIKELTLNFDKPVNNKVYLFVGLNESGKTTILEAIDFILNHYECKKGKKREDCYSHIIPKSRISNFSDNIEISLSVKLSSGDRERLYKELNEKYSRNYKIVKSGIPTTFDYFRKLQFKNSIFISEEDDLSFVFEKNRIKSKRGKEIGLNKYKEMRKELKNRLRNFLPTVIYWPDFLPELPDRIYIKYHDSEESLQEEEKYIKNMLQDILNSIQDDEKSLDLDTHIIKRIGKNSEVQKEALEATISKLNDAVSKALRKYWEVIFPSRKHGEKRELVFKFDEDQKGVFVQLRLKDATTQYKITELSRGFRWFLTFLLFIMFRPYRRNKEGLTKGTSEIVFLLDEPASNLHDSAQQRLLSLFDKLRKKSKLIYTTHSPHLINPIWLGGAYVIKNKAIDYERIDSTVRETSIIATPYKEFVNKHPDKKAYFSPILDALDYRPAKIELSGPVLIVEGISDYIFLEFFKRSFLKKGQREEIDGDFINTIEGIKVYPSTGADNIDCVIKYLMVNVSEFKVLVDNDSAGVNFQGRIKKKYGNLLNRNVVKLQEIVGEEFESVKEIEDLFSDKAIKLLRQEFPDRKGKKKQLLLKTMEILLLQGDYSFFNDDEETFSAFLKLWEGISELFSS